MYIHAYLKNSFNRLIFLRRIHSSKALRGRQIKTPVIKMALKVALDLHLSFLISICSV